MVKFIVIAYVLSGIVGIILDYRRPIYDRPAYVRQRGPFGPIAAILLWLPMLVLILIMHKIIQGKDAGILALFIALSALGIFLA